MSAGLGKEASAHAGSWTSSLQTRDLLQPSPRPGHFGTARDQPSRRGVCWGKTQVTPGAEVAPSKLETSGPRLQVPQAMRVATHEGHHRAWKAVPPFSALSLPGQGPPLLLRPGSSSCDGPQCSQVVAAPRLAVVAAGPASPPKQAAGLSPLGRGYGQPVSLGLPSWPGPCHKPPRDSSLSFRSCSWSD